MLQRNTDASLWKRDRLWSSFGMGISPSIYTHMHILYLYKHRSNRACCKVLRLQECTHGANPHTCTHFSCMAQLKMGTKDAVLEACAIITDQWVGFKLHFFYRFFPTVNSTVFFYRYHFWNQFPNGPFFIFFLIFIFTGGKKNQTFIL